MAEGLDHPFSRVAAYGGVGYLYLWQGDLHQAIAVLEQGVDLSQVWQMQFLFPYVAEPLGATYALSGRVAQALPLLEQATAMQFIPFIASGLHALSERCLRAGRREDAVPLAIRSHPGSCVSRRFPCFMT
jgi:hypothetical protein